MSNFNSQVFAPTGTQAKKKSMTKWIVIIIIIVCVIYFYTTSKNNNRLPGETCRYNTDCKNKYCKCKNGGTVCSRYNKVCA
jgi:hypothetical protein